jgi:hypothetical protein
MHFFPMTWFSNLLLPKTSAEVINTGTAPVTFRELLCFLGIGLLMLTCSGWNTDRFWSYKNIPCEQEEDPCPYNFKTFMSKRRFIAILRHLHYTNFEAPAFVSKFW